MKLDIVYGVEGYAIYLDDFRIAGPKPWGAGRLVKSWTVSSDTLRSAGFTKARKARADVPDLKKGLGEK